MPRFLFLLISIGLFAQDTGELAKALSSYRQRIDGIDARIMKLLNQRAEVVRDVGRVKMRFHATAVAPAREEQVLRHVSTQARAPLTPESARAIYRAILAEMASMEQKDMERPTIR
jgi:chorismate mutase/prephenate dehydratase